VVDWLVSHKAHVAGSAAAAATLAYLGYKGYRAYHSDSAARVASALRNYSATAACLSGTARLLASDLHAWLSSDSDEVPQSIRQLTKLIASPEAQAAVEATTGAAARALADQLLTSVAARRRGEAVASDATAGATHDNGANPQLPRDALTTVIDALLSDRGHSLVGMAVGLATRNATATFCEFLERVQLRAAHGEGTVPGADAAAATGRGRGEQGGGLHTVLAFLSSEPGERLLSLLITRSMGAAVGAYVEATAGYNVYSDMVAAVTPRVGWVDPWSAFAGQMLLAVTAQPLASVAHARGKGGR
jgi:hypothetical protein